MNIQTIKIKGTNFVLIPEAEYHRLVGQADIGPTLPAKDAKGRRPAVSTMRAIMARQLVADRQAAGLTQTALARRAGIRQETLSRIESGKHTASQRTIEKIDKALAKATRLKKAI